MESIIYEKDEFGRIKLFDKLFEAVRDVDRTRIKEQKYIEVQVQQAHNHITESKQVLDQVSVKVNNFWATQNKMLEDIQKMYDSNSAWQKQFLKKNEESHLEISRQLSTFRQKCANYDAHFITLDQDMQKAFVDLQAHQNRVSNHEARLCSSEETMLKWGTVKMNVEDFETYKSSIRQELIEN